MTEKQIEQLEKRTQDKCYIIAVNSFIPKASTIATRSATGSRKEIGVNGNEFEYDTWTEIFHREMNRLCREAGIR